LAAAVEFWIADSAVIPVEKATGKACQGCAPSPATSELAFQAVVG
jgi:hypothetical protein